MHKRMFLVLLLVVLVSGMLAVLTTAQDESAVDEEMLAYGEYLANIAGCVACHTPYQAEYADFSQLTPEQLQTLVLFGDDALDREKILSGVRPFDLGPAGVLFSGNLTPDEETGLGAWTDAEIEAAIRIGVSRDGRRLHPLMPYRNYYTMAREDMTALIAYLRSVPAVNNPVPPGPTGEGIAPELEPPTELAETGPDGSDPIERGAYLVNVIMSCADCHTPIDVETGAPIFDQWLAGGQPFEGPWGIVYGANLTPHPERGLGSWTADDIRAVFRTGVRIDGRQLVLMPWQDYEIITDEDLDAVIAYLKDGIEPIDNEVPAPAIDPLFIVQGDE